MTKTFDFFNFKHYPNTNPYLNTSALVFDFALADYAKPLAIKDYEDEIIRALPQLSHCKFHSYTELVAKVVSFVNKLEMNLHIDRYTVTKLNDGNRIAIQSLDKNTSLGVIDLVADWLEDITLDVEFDYQKEIVRLQQKFRRSVYGGPTVYSLLKTAYQRQIPTFYLPDERLMQYGYGKYLVRGIATTFDCDSQLDSDFTTHKDDCKDFLASCGFPVPQGRIVSYLKDAIAAAEEIGYPVAIKPVVGHKGIGVTANIQDEKNLEFAYERALEAITQGNIALIVEKSITGADYRLLCVDGKFVAAMERRPPFVTGNGTSTIGELIEQENSTPARLDTPSSPLGKIPTDEIMKNYLAEQFLSLDSVPDDGQIVYLRKVANLSAGGVSIDATRKIHPDNMILAQQIAQYFRLVCLGIDVIAKDISKSWKEGDFGILEINAAPGIYMHLCPAVGESVDVPAKILETLFPQNKPSRIPIITFNTIGFKDLRQIIEHILLSNPNLTIAGICHEGILLNRLEKNVQPNYNTSVQSLLRNRQLDLLIAEYTEDIFLKEGMFYEGSNMIVLNNPTEIERALARDLLPNGTLIIKQKNNVFVQAKGLIENYNLQESDEFKYIYLKEITRTVIGQ